VRPRAAGDGASNPRLGARHRRPQHRQSLRHDHVRLLAWLGRKRNEPKASAAADRIQAAVKTVIAGRKHLSRDLGGQSSTTDMGDAIAAAVQ
jgi:hypothetical protein